jgi:4-amino-4-deoxy-L-arabinose transferase-like glycosyltransferase
MNSRGHLRVFSCPFKLGVVALLLLAFGLRVYALDSRPLWWDEGLTLTYAYLAPAANLELAVTTEHLNPPLFNWLVGAHTFLTGITVFGARLVSVYGGLLAAAAAYAMTTLAFNHLVGVITLLLMAVAPMQIYHSQEAKGYTVETAALFIALYCWYRLHQWALDRRDGKRGRVTTASWPWWVGYALAMLMAMGTNYLAAFALIVINLFTIAVTIRAAGEGLGRRALFAHWLRWLAVQAAGLLPLLPYVLGSLDSSVQGLENTAADADVYTPASYLWTFLGHFTISERPGGQIGVWLTVLILCLAGAGLLSRVPRKWRSGRRLVAAWLFVPLALGYLYHARFTWFFPRYLLYIQPALPVLAAMGLARLSRRRPGVPAASLFATAIVLLSVPILHNHYRSPPDSSEDANWPLLFEEMRPYVREGDGLIARTSWIPGYMMAYLPPAPQSEWMLGYFDQETIDETLGSFLDHHERVWQIDYRMEPLSADNDATAWMRSDAAAAFSRQIGTASATLFVANSELEAAVDTDEQVSQFENGVHVRWTPQSAVVRAGDVVGLSVTWWTDRLLDVWLVRFLHVLSSDGTLVAQVDREPVLGASRSYDWAPWQMIADPIAIALPPDLPPGHYRLQLGLYDRDTLARVKLVEGDDTVVVGEIEVQ